MRSSGGRNLRNFYKSHCPVESYVAIRVCCSVSFEVQRCSETSVHIGLHCSIYQKMATFISELFYSGPCMYVPKNEV
jgi:hypothetical protein